MKKFFEIIGFIALACFSFFYTNKISTVIMVQDDLLKQIESLKEQSYIKPIDAYIENDTIIPGISGREIDIDESYKKMKQLGSFNDNLLVYKTIKPNISIKDNKDKCIIKGSSKRMVSLVFDVSDNIQDILSILNKKGVQGNFFVNNEWFEKNNQIIMDLNKQGHIIGSSDTNINNLSWQNSILKKIVKQNNTYCYRKVMLEKCFKQDSYTIEPIILNDNYLLNIKNSLSNGAIISLKVNNSLSNELDAVIDYINHKGYDIVNLDILINE